MNTGSSSGSSSGGPTTASRLSASAAVVAAARASAPPPGLSFNSSMRATDADPRAAAEPEPHSVDHGTTTADSTAAAVDGEFKSDDDAVHDTEDSSSSSNGNNLTSGLSVEWKNGRPTLAGTLEGQEEELSKKKPPLQARGPSKRSGGAAAADEDKRPEWQKRASAARHHLKSDNETMAAARSGRPHGMITAGPPMHVLKAAMESRGGHAPGNLGKGHFHHGATKPRSNRSRNDDDDDEGASSGKPSSSAKPFRSRDYEIMRVDMPPGVEPGQTFGHEYRPGHFVDLKAPKRGMFGGVKTWVKAKIPLDLEEAIAELQRGPMNAEDIRLGKTSHSGAAPSGPFTAALQDASGGSGKGKGVNSDKHSGHAAALHASVAVEVGKALKLGPAAAVALLSKQLVRLTDPTGGDAEAWASVQMVRVGLGGGGGVCTNVIWDTHITAYREYRIQL